MKMKMGTNERTRAAEPGVRQRGQVVVGAQNRRNATNHARVRAAGRCARACGARARGSRCGRCVRRKQTKLIAATGKMGTGKSENARVKMRVRVRGKRRQRWVNAKRARVQNENVPCAAKAKVRVRCA